MCVYDRCADEGRIDLLAAKLFVLLFDWRYGSHGDNRLEYGNGSWQRASCISSPALQYATDSIRYAQSVFTLMTTNGDSPSRDSDGVSESDRLILDSKTINGAEETSLLGQPDKKPAWTFYCAELCSSLFESFTERSRRPMDFHKCGAAPMPGKRRGGDCAGWYWLIGGDRSAQSRKSCDANFYVAAPASLLYNTPFRSNSGDAEIPGYYFVGL